MARRWSSWNAWPTAPRLAAARGNAMKDSPLNELCRRLLQEMGEPDPVGTLPAIQLALDVAVQYPEVIPRPACNYVDQLAPMLVDLTYLPEAEAMWTLLYMDCEPEESAAWHEQRAVDALKTKRPENAGAWLVDCFFGAKIDELEPRIE